ncbi:transglycosylase domain-containing protein, partial [Nitrospira sp. BLG_2]|uniref:transglycosylase domain-containing protein n=1 Tax=Nitrospira sp. BLG_2 TaxID=3397507 RepID=UPI003B9C13BB
MSTGRSMDARRKANHTPTFLRHYTYDPPPRKSTGRRTVGRLLLWSVLLIGLPVSVLVLSWLSTLPDTDLLARTNPTSTALMDHRLARAAEQGRAGKRQWLWTPLSRIAPELQRAVIAAEDASFFAHEGFDWEGIRDAALYNLEAGELKRGGSTITQQLAKNLYLSSERSLFR